MSFISATLGRIVHRYRTVAEWAEIYGKVVAAKPIQLKTKQNRVGYIKRIVGELGERSVGAVRPHEIAAFIGDVAAEHPHLARRMLIETRDMFREAVNYGWIDRDPCHGIRTPRVRVARLRLTFEQWSAMHDWAARHSPPWVSRMLVLALVTGQRRGDLRAMRFSDVWSEQVDGVAVPCLHIEQQKTGTRVAIPTSLRLDALGMTVADAVAQCRDYASLEDDGDAWLVRKTTGAPPVGASMSWRFEQAREGALPPADADADPPSLHECRSLAARMYDAQGVRDVQTLLGHSHASMTELTRTIAGSIVGTAAGKWCPWASALAERPKPLYFSGFARARQHPGSPLAPSAPMPAATLSELETLIDDLVRDAAQWVSPEQRERAIELALARYSHDRPREMVEDVVTADGVTVPLPLGWVSGASDLRTVECPVTTPPVPLEADAWAVWRTPSGEAIGLLQAATPGATARLHYGAPHRVDATSTTIPTAHREAVACYAASVLAEQIATVHASAQDATIAADRVDQAHPAREWAMRAKSYRARYFAHLGIDVNAQGVEQPRIDAAGVVVDLTLPTSHGRGRMYRRR